MRRLYADWEDVTRVAVEQLRRFNATTPDDPELRRLVAELSAGDDVFAYWRRQAVAAPLVGELEFEWSALTWNADPGMQIIVWTATPGSASRERLARLRILA